MSLSDRLVPRGKLTVAAELRELDIIDLDGAAYMIVVTCLRMLPPRERRNANDCSHDIIMKLRPAQDGTVLPFTLDVRTVARQQSEDESEAYRCAVMMDYGS